MFKPASLATILLACVAYVLAIPTWEHFASRSSMGDLVPGASVIEAKGGPYGKAAAWYLSNASPKGSSFNLIQNIVL